MAREDLRLYVESEPWPSVLPESRTRHSQAPLMLNRVRWFARYLAEKPHLAATERDVQLARFVRDRFQEAGFDSAQLVPYNLYLSKPDPLDPNKARFDLTPDP